jgi:Ca2+-binding EF-hand superfamily protein
VQFIFFSLCPGTPVHSYAQELPSRCKKEIVSAADINKDGTINEEKLSTILYNIGASEALSKQDLRNIFQELGGSGSQTISVHQMYDIL